MRAWLWVAVAVGLVARKTADQQVETAAIAGKLVDAAAFLNSGVVDVIQEAKNAGLLYREDLPSEVGMSFPPHPRKPARQSGRFACRTDGRTDDG